MPGLTGLSSLSGLSGIAGGSTADALLGSLVAYWRMREAHGSRAADAGPALAETNTVPGTGSAGGKCAVFVTANSESLSAADSAAVSTGDIDFTWAGWVFFASVAAAQGIVGKWAAGQKEYLVYFSASSNRLSFWVSADGTSDSVFLKADTLGIPVAGRWYFVVCWHDSVADTCNIQVDDGGVDSVAYAGGVRDGTETLYLGRWGGGDYLGGRLDNWGFWKRVLTAAERTAIYNGGIGKQYSDLTTAETVSLISWWNLDEVSGARADSAGSTSLTDNNTVTQDAGAVGTASRFDSANSELLSVADAAAVSFTDEDFTIAAWVRLDTTAGTQGLITKWHNTAGSREYALYYGATASRFSFLVNNTGGADVEVVANTFGAPVVSTWYFIEAWHDATGNTLNIRVNRGTADSVSTSAGVRDGTNILRLGVDQGSSYLTGALDAVGFWRRLLSAIELDYLYNGGTGREYPF